MNAVHHPLASRLRPPGFTLVELMVVVVILGILATVVTLSVTDYLVKGKQSAARAELAQISTALNLFYTEFDRYPGNDEGLALLLAPHPTYPHGILSGDLLDPWGHEYVYVYPGIHGVFDLCSFGANGQEGGTGADADLCTGDGGENEVIVDFRFSIGDWGIRRDGTSDRGFTLLELLVVVSIMALAVGMVALRLDGFTDEGRLHATAAQLTSIVKAAQTRALVSGTPRVLDYVIPAQRLRLRTPTPGGQGAFDNGAVFEWPAGVVLERVLLESRPGSHVDGTEVAVVIAADGRFASHAAIFRSHDLHAVIWVTPFDEPPASYLRRPPLATSWDVLRTDLEVADGER